jgi:hypothetical protein
MNAKRNALAQLSESELARIDAHEIQPEEYEELPALTDAMQARAELRIGERTIYSFPQQQITLQLPTDAFERWVASGPRLAVAHGETPARSMLNKKSRHAPAFCL